MSKCQQMTRGGILQACLVEVALHIYDFGMEDGRAKFQWGKGGIALHINPSFNAPKDMLVPYSTLHVTVFPS